MAVDFDPRSVEGTDPPWLKPYTREMHLAWNPTLRALRPDLDKALTQLAKSLSQ